MANALLVNRKLSRWPESRSFWAEDIDFLDPLYKIYVPQRFVLGHFSKRKYGFKLWPDRIFYTDSAENVVQYQKNINEKKLEVVRSFLIPDPVLESIMKQGRAYISAKAQIVEQAKLVGQYLV